jgi:hypothetical protein
VVKVAIAQAPLMAMLSVGAFKKDKEFGTSPLKSSIYIGVD